LKIVLGNGQKWWKIAPDEIKKKVAKKFLRKEKKKIRNGNSQFEKVENDHNDSHYQQHFCLDYDQMDNCNCDSN